MWNALKRGLSAMRKAANVISISSIFDGIFSGMKLSNLADYKSYIDAGTGKVWALFRCADLTAQVVTQQRHVIRKVGGDGKPIVNKQIEALLANPNDFQTFREIVHLTDMHLSLTGNAFWAKDETNMDGNRPRAIYLLNPARINLIIDSKQGITGYRYMMSSGQSIYWEPKEIVHFRRPNPSNEYWGLGRVEAGTTLFQDVLNRSAWSSKFWSNGASPTGIMVCEEQNRTAQELRQLKLEWQKEYGGTENSGKTAWLTGKWRYEQLGLTATEMQNLEAEQWNVESIAHLMGVPLSLLGFQAKSGGMTNYGTAQVDDLHFRRDTVAPDCRLIAEQITKSLIAGFDPTLEFAFEVSGLIDREGLVVYGVPLLRNGVITRNELRKMAGLEEDMSDPTMNEYVIESSLVPAALSGINGPQAATTGKQADEIVSRMLHRSAGRTREIEQRINGN